MSRKAKARKQTRFEQYKSKQQINKKAEQQAEHFVTTSPRLAFDGDYEALAQLGAKQGAWYMWPKVNTTPNDELGFAPEFYLFNKTTGKVMAICTPGGGEMLDDIRRDLFEKYGPDVVLQVGAGWTANSSNALPGMRPRSQPNRITVSVGTVFTAANTKVAEWMAPVGTKEDFRRAGLEAA